MDPILTPILIIGGVSLLVRTLTKKTSAVVDTTQPGMAVDVPTNQIQQNMPLIDSANGRTPTSNNTVIGQQASVPDTTLATAAQDFSLIDGFNKAGDAAMARSTKAVAEIVAAQSDALATARSIFGVAGDIGNKIGGVLVPSMDKAWGLGNAFMTSGSMNRLDVGLAAVGAAQLPYLVQGMRAPRLEFQAAVGPLLAAVSRVANDKAVAQARIDVAISEWRAAISAYTKAAQTAKNNTRVRALVDQASAGYPRGPLDQLASQVASIHALVGTVPGVVRSIDSLAVGATRHLEELGTLLAAVRADGNGTTVYATSASVTRIKNNLGGFVNVANPLRDRGWAITEQTRAAKVALAGIGPVSVPSMPSNSSGGTSGMPSVPGSGIVPGDLPSLRGLGGVQAVYGSAPQGFAGLGTGGTGGVHAGFSDDAGEARSFRSGSGLGGALGDPCMTIASPLAGLGRR